METRCLMEFFKARQIDMCLHITLDLELHV